MSRQSLSRACWNLRFTLLFMIAPAIGLVVVATTFGLSSGLRHMALAMALFDLALMGLLLRAEMRRQALAARR